MDGRPNHGNKAAFPKTSRVVRPDIICNDCSNVHDVATLWPEERWGRGGGGGGRVA